VEYTSAHEVRFLFRDWENAMNTLLDYNYRGLKSKHPLNIIVEPDREIKDYWFAGIDALEENIVINGVGETEQEAIDELIRWIYSDYHDYAKEDDSKLDSLARELAAWYREHFERVGPVI